MLDLITITFGITAQIPKEGLIASYPFNANTIDESGNGYNGNIQGALLSTDRCEIDDNAYFFDGIDDYIYIGDISDLDESKSLSISAWIKSDGITDIHTGTIVSKYNAEGNSERVFIFDLYPDNTLRLCIYGADGNADWEKQRTSNPIPYSQWNHVVAVWNGLTQNIDIYVNGVEVDSYYENNGIRPIKIYDKSSPLIIGGSEYGFNTIDYMFNGSIDDVLIYNRVLTYEEILELYHYTCYKADLIGDDFVCVGEIDKTYYVVSKTEISDYDWSYSGTGVTIDENSDSININFSNSATSGLLKVTVSSDSLGTTTLELPIAVNSKPRTGTIIGDSIVCPNKTGYNYNTSIYDNIDEYIWNYTGTGASFNTNNLPSILIDFAEDATSGILTVSGKNECGTSEPAILFIYVDTTIPTIGEIIGENELCKNHRNVFRIEIEENIQQYNWQYTSSDIDFSSSYDSAVIYFLESGPGVLTVTGENKCGIAASSPPFTIYVDPCDINIPNSFTPNNDGINDVFYIRNLPENTRVMIFNRIGEELYRTDNYQNNWDGKKNNGKIIETGTYWYIVIVPLIQEPYSGFVYLKR